MRIHRRHRYYLGLVAFLIGLAVVAAFVLPIALTPSMRTRLCTALGQRFDSDVAIASLQVSLLPRLRVSGEGLVVRHHRRSEIPPLISIASFSAEANPLGVIGRPLRFKSVQLEGLEVTVPPGGIDIDDTEGDDAPEDGTRDGDTAAAESPLIVDDVRSERAILRLLRRRAHKQPRIFEIHHLSMQDAGSYDPWSFRATLTNPTPPGVIEARGTFGPWNAGQPALTPLNAQYEFRNANLAVFGGIRGRLHSTGHFGGVLERIEVDGQADVPDFALEDGNRVPLTTRFQSVVDATNGNTWLEPVSATLLRTAILARGGIVEREGEAGRTVTLDAVISNGRIEDVLYLAVEDRPPPLTGELKLDMKLVLPPGNDDELERLRLDGSFEVATARFTSADLQAKTVELSRKAVGKAKTPPNDVASNLRGTFVLRGGVIRFSNVTFSVPGAHVNVAGTYALRSEALDFRGTLRLDAKLSELTTGAESFFLKLFDPLVRRKDVTVVPMTIRGTIADPKFGVDWSETLFRR